MEITCAALAGVAARLICHPLDTIKTVCFTGFASLQGLSADNISPGRSFCRTAVGASSPTRIARENYIWVCAGHIWRTEGLRGFYRGAGITIPGSAPGVGLYLSSYNYCHNCLLHYLTHAKEQRSRKNGSDQEGSNETKKIAWDYTFWNAWIAFISGLFAEAVSCVIWVPIDVTKERLQSQPSCLVGRYQNSRHALETILRLEGVKGLYRGYFSTLGSFGPFSGVYFVTYEYFSHFLSHTWSSSVSTSNASRNSFSSVGGKDGAHRPPWIPLASGFGATIVAGLLCNPMELVKTRLQVQQTVLLTPRTCATSGSETHNTPIMRRTLQGSPRLFSYQYKGLVDGITQMVKTDGFLSLWQGAFARVAFQAPNAALTMTFYEYLLKRYRWGGEGRSGA